MSHHLPQLRDHFFLIKVFYSLSPCWFFICGGEWHKPIIHCTMQSYFWHGRLRSDARRVIGPDYIVRFWGGRHATSKSWTQIMILIIILDKDYDLNLYLGLTSWIQIMILNHAPLASFADPLLSLIKIHFSATSNPFWPLSIIYLFPGRISMLLFPWECCISSLGKWAYGMPLAICFWYPGSPGWLVMNLHPFAMPFNCIWVCKDLFNGRY